MKSTGMLAVASLAGLIFAAGCCDKCKKCDKCEQKAGTTTEMKSSDASTGSGAHAMVVSQKVCPVSGEPIDLKVSTDYQGKKVYFCCDGCIKKFEKDPDTFMSKMK